LFFLRKEKNQKREYLGRDNRILYIYIVRPRTFPSEFSKIIVETENSIQRPAPIVLRLGIKQFFSLPGNVTFFFLVFTYYSESVLSGRSRATHDDDDDDTWNKYCIMHARAHKVKSIHRRAYRDIQRLSTRRSHGICWTFI